MAEYSRERSVFVVNDAISWRNSELKTGKNGHFAALLRFATVIGCAYRFIKKYYRLSRGKFR